MAGTLRKPKIEAQQEELSKEARELLANMQSQQWRLRNLYRIKNEKGIEIPFEPMWAQQRLVTRMATRNVRLKGRKLGVTTGYLILWLDTALFNANVKIGVIADTKPHAEAWLEDVVKFAYDRLPEEVRAANPIVESNKSKIRFKNGSSIVIAVSFMSDTPQILHISELGPIAQKKPNVAHEIKVGSIESVPPDGIVVIESTARGRAGLFYDIVQMGLKGIDWDLDFLPWYEDPRCIKFEYDALGKQVPHTEIQEHRDYLDKLQAKIGRLLRPEQRAFWCWKRRSLGDDIWSEFPSEVDEAFKQSTEGAYYGPQMLKAWQTKRIASFAVDPGIAVDTWWDIGMHDYTSIWFVQSQGNRKRLVHFYQNSGEGLPHYAKYLKEWRDKHDIVYRDHVAPHDIKVREWGAAANAEARFMSAQKLGINFVVAPDISKADGINSVRNLLPLCEFDEEQCADGIECLENYRKQWNALTGSWRDEHVHDEYSHGADAFRIGSTYSGTVSALANTVTKAIETKKRAKIVW